MLTNTKWIDQYCLNKPGVTQDFKEEWGWMRYDVGDKMFAILAYDQHHERILLTIRTDAAYSEMLQQEYLAIVPGYYCNKLYYTSIWFDVDAIPERDRHYQPNDIYPNQKVMQELIDQAYQLCLEKLSKKKQLELMK